MNPNYVHTITLYRKQPDGSFKREVLTECFWKSGIAATQSGTQASQSNIYTVRIPADKVEKGFCVTTGHDMVIYGECADEVSGEKGSRAAELLLAHKPLAFKVSAFTDNTGHRADKHYRLGG